MRLLLASLALLATAGTAYADPPSDGITKTADQTELPWIMGPSSEADPFLHLDGHLRLSVDDLDAKLERFERRLQLGDHARIVLTTDWRQVDHQIPLRGWRTGAAGSYDIAGVTLSASAGVEQVDTDLGRGTLTTAGIAVGKSFRLSRTVRGWIGVSLGQRRWLGKPPAGDADATHLLLGARLTY